ncbi:MAG: tRNA (adenosine(37)-N6)-threonylcarbamoyltransferase complex dimerization subunit type 1 TsaB [Patescibacteria group bacterium]
MLTLAMDTASSTTSIALLDGDKLLDERSWKSNQNEAEKLLPEIMKLVPDMYDIKRIIAVSGPGSFTGLRVGVTVANTLSFLTKAELYGVDSFSVWGKRCDEGVLLIKAGRREVFLDEKVREFDEVAEELKGQKVFGDLLPEQKEKVDLVDESGIRSFGEVIGEIKLGEPVDIIQPNYKRPPQITISKDKWKKQK